MARVIINGPTLEECKEALKLPPIGSGVDRTVYRVPGSLWVYKKEKRYAKGTNADEYGTFVQLRHKLPDGIALPEMVLLSNEVLAAEYIENEVEQYADPNSECDFGWHIKCKDENACWTTPWVNKIESTGYNFDVHGGNILINDGIIYIIDLG